MMLRRLGAQIHDYNIKLTKAELLALSRIKGLYDSSSTDFRILNDIMAFVCREAERLDNAQGEQRQEVPGNRS